MKRIIPIILLALSSQATLAQSFETTEEKIKAAMANDIRTEAEMERDKNRLPLQTLEFFGLREDMKILELLPGGGWYTKILAPVVRDNGEYYAAIGTSGIRENLIGEAPLDKVSIVGEKVTGGQDGDSYFVDLEIEDIGVDDLDIVFTFRNYHNLSTKGRKAMNDAAFEALKPGGVYAVIDHTKRHMEEPSAKNRRRVDPVIAIKEIQDAGFVLEDYSTLHYREDDELVYEVGARSIAGNTDRWTFKFIKPKE
jgi:predicted methyltransferase